MFAAFLTQANIGILYSLFTTAIAGIAFLIVGLSIQQRKKFFGQKDHYSMNFLGRAWIWLGLAFGVDILRLVDIIQTGGDLDKILYFLYLTFISVHLFYLFRYLITVLFSIYYSSQIVSFVSILLPTSILFFSFIEGVSAISGQWYVTWQLPEISVFMLKNVIFYTLIALIVGIFIKELYLSMKEKNVEYNQKMLFSTFALTAFVLLFTPDLLGNFIDWKLPLIRSFIITVPLTTYLIYTGREDVFFDQALQSLFKKALGYSSLTKKNLLLVLFSAILPIGLGLLLMYYFLVIILSNTGIGEVSLYLSNLAYQILIIGTILSIIIFFVSTIFIRMISSRLKIIYKGNYEVLNKNYAYKIEQLDGSDEITLLARFFNQASSFLESYEEQIHTYRETLEQQVLQRTAQLEKATAHAKELAAQQESFFKGIESQTDLIFDNMSDGVIVLDAEFVIKKYNASFAAQFSLTENSILEKNFHEITEFSSYHENIVRIIKEMVEQKQQFADHTLKADDKKQGRVECSFSLILDEESQDLKNIIIVWRKVEPPWGVVYDSKSLEPLKLVVVRLFNEETNGLVDTQVTDAQGRYGFYVKPGKYSLSLLRDGYHFPPKKREGYFGQVLEVHNGEDGAIKFDIYMDNVSQEDESDSIEIGSTSKVTKSENTQDVGVLKSVEELESS